MDTWRVLTFSLLLFLALAGSAAAQLPDPEVTFIPDQISANSSFVMIVDPGTDDPVRVTWQACDITCQFGSLPLINDKYMCYFSDTDEKSTCGPVPFRYSMDELGLPYEIAISTIDTAGRLGNETVMKETGGLKIVPEITKDFDTGEVSMLVWIDKPAESVYYKVFDSSFDEKTSGYVPMGKIQATPYYSANVTLEPGIYYIAFRADSASDFGGGMEKVVLGFSEGGEGVTEGVIRGDPINIDVLYEAGTEPALPQDYKIYNTINQSFTGISIALPAEISQYVTLTIPNSSLAPYQSVYYTINLRNVVSSLDLDAVAEIKSGAGTTLGRFPVKMKVSYVEGGSVAGCGTADDGDFCLGGICCSGSCRERAECCVDSDCSSGRCTTSYRCESGSTEQSCITGSCVTGSFSCPTGQEETGTCTQGGTAGICCASSTGGECDGAFNGDTCSFGICCSEECVSGECCTTLDCNGIDEKCRSNYCVQDTDGGGEMDYTLLMIVALIAVAGGVGAWYYFTKIRKPKTAEERFEDEDKDVFDDEEFY